MGIDQFLTLLSGQQFLSSNPGLAAGIRLADSAISNTLALGLTSPNLPDLPVNLPAVAGASTYQLTGSPTFGYALFIFSLSALAMLFYILGQKKGLVENELFKK